MKIGIVLPSVPSYSETFFTSKIKGLQANGFEVILFVNNFSTKTALNCTIISSPKFSKNKLKNSFLSFYYFLKTFIFTFKSTHKLYELNRKDNLTILQNIKNIIINCHILTQKLDWLHFGFGTMAIDRENVAEAIGAKMAVSFRGFDIGIYPIKHPNCYDKLWKKVDKIHVISDDIEDLVSKYGFKDQYKIEKITPAIDINYFKTNNSERDLNRIITVARLNWKKGLEYTLEALKIVKENGVEFQYYIIGDGIEIERLQFAVYQLGLKENVFFLGKLSRKQVKEEMEKSTYYIQYSLQEGFCNAVLEAQAMGLVCFVSDAEGLSENILNNETGFVIPKRNPLLLANKIIEVSNSSNQDKVQLTNKAIQRINSTFTIHNQTQQFVGFYKNELN
jgi:glycosyltransferase involved in cell wall biosynthesis